MSITNGLELMNALEPFLKSYMHFGDSAKVIKQLWGKQDFPAFDTFCIVLSPVSPQFSLKTFKTIQESFSFEVICIRKNNDPQKSVFSKEERGIIPFVYDVYSGLFQFILKNRHSGIDCTMKELSEAIPINEKNESDLFYWIVKIPVQIKFKEFEIKEEL